MMESSSEKKVKSNELLEIPSERSQSLRRELLMEKLIKEGPPGRVQVVEEGQGHPKKRTSRNQTSRIPRSSLLTQVQSFLPQIKRANEVLESVEDKESVIMEIVPKDAESYVEMDIALFEDETDDNDNE